MTHQDGRDINAGLVIQEGRCYRDRAGKVHGPMCLSGDDQYPWEDWEASWTATGRWIGADDDESDLDLIAEAFEPLRARTATTNGEG